MKKSIFTLALLVSVLLTSIAQTPQLFNYQATLRNNNGQLLVSDDISVRISILQNSTDGTPVYSETHAVTTTSQGIVNLKIGSESGTDEFADINWSNGPYFLKIEIDTENSGAYTELGVTQLLSVPYALYAEKANSLMNESVSYWSKNLNNIYYNDGLVGIGTASPKNKLSIVGNETEWPGRILFSIRNQNTGPKSLAYLKIHTGSDETGTSLGHISATYTANGSPSDIADFGILASSANGLIINATKPDLSPGIIKFFNGQTPDTKFIETMRISETGKVGIGRHAFESYYNPKLWLHNGWLQVSDSTDQDAGIVVSHLNKTGYGYARTVHQVYEGVNGDPFTEFRIRSNNDENTITSWSVGADNDDEDKFKINLRTDHPTGSSPSYGNNLLTLTTAGNLGIGTSEPSAKLNIVGNVDEGDERSFIRLRNYATGPKASVSISLQSFENKGVSFGYTSSNYSMNDLSDFGVVTTNGRGLAFVSYYGQIRFYTNKNEDNTYSEKMRINEEGNVGIGTTTPKAKLEIADGDVYIKDISKGIIMTSPDGQCWRGTINNSGVLEFAAVECP